MNNRIKPRINVGLVGCGVISPTYLTNIRENYNDIINIVACSDLSSDLAYKTSKNFEIPKILTFEELLEESNIEVILNLTPPNAHAPITIKAIEAGKHVYSEKPLAIELKDGQKIIDKAIENNVMVGCAPDTILGPGIQTCRKIIEEGIIGEPTAVITIQGNRGHEGWHPNAEFYYQKGGGPIFDMGPYYLSTLINLLGPVKRVTGSHKKTFSKRTKKNNTTINVEVPTHVVGILDFQSGVIGNIFNSFDTFQPTCNNYIEIYGTTGTLTVPNPNSFSGPINLLTRNNNNEMERKEVSLAYDEEGAARGIGLVEMAWAIKDQRICRTNANIANHVLEIIHAVHQASDVEKHITLNTTCEQPNMLPIGMSKGVFNQ